MLVVLGVAFAGATFGLNPLGDERNVLPAVLTTPSAGRLVRARLVAGLAWLPVALGGVALGGAIGRFSAFDALFLAIAVGVLCAFSGTVALAIGVLTPRFEPIAATKSEVVTPSFGAFVGHSILIGIAGLGALTVVFGPTLLGVLSESAPSFTARIIPVCMFAAVVLGASAWSYRYASRAFEAQTID